MTEVKETYLDRKPYEDQLIFDDYVLTIISSNLSYAREGCSELGQGNDVLFSRFPEIDLDMIVHIGDHLKKEYNIDELPMGVIKNKRGIVTLTGGKQF